MKFSEGFKNLPAKKQEMQKAHFDEKGALRKLREMPDGTIALLSQEEFIEEM